MGKRKIKAAICYDFDGTLAPGNMQEHSLLPELNLKPTVFWKKVKELAKNHNMNEVLAYMYLTLKKSEENNHPIKREAFKKHGKTIKLFEGVPEFFDEVKKYAGRKNIAIEHYIISSGLKEIIEGTSIAKEFKYIFASEFFYDINGVAKWPALAIDYTAKTQFLFRINKGIFNIWDNTTINKYIPENNRYIPFSRIIYIGDGETDIPCMKMVNYQGGYSIAVYEPHKRKAKQICQTLMQQGRARFMAPANYNKESSLFNLIIKIIDKIHADHQLNS